MSKRPLRSVLFAVAALGLGLGACGVTGENQRTGAGRPAAAAATSLAGEPARPAGAAEEPRGFLGVLVARQSVDVAAETSGRLRAIEVRAGDVVARGALLASVDTQVAGQDLEAARAVLRQAEVEEEKSRISLADAKGRLARRQSFPEAFPKEEIIGAENQRDAANAAVEGARARVREQRIRVEQLGRIAARGELRAPFAGTVGVHYLDAGSMVSVGTPVVRIVGGSDRLARFAIPERERQGLAPGQPVTIVLRGSSRELRGAIETISPEVDAPSGMVLAEARIDLSGPAAALQPGEVVRVVPGGK
jgi:membrane fusion protein (multidrug efflux system)